MKNFSTLEFKKKFYIYYVILILKRRKQQPWSKWGRDSHFVRIYLTQSQIQCFWIEGFEFKARSLDWRFPGLGAAWRCCHASSDLWDYIVTVFSGCPVPESIQTEDKCFLHQSRHHLWGRTAIDQGSLPGRCWEGRRTSSGCIGYLTSSLAIALAHTSCSPAPLAGIVLSLYLFFIVARLVGIK